MFLADCVLCGWQDPSEIQARPALVYTPFACMTLMLWCCLQECKAGLLSIRAAFKISNKIINKLMDSNREAERRIRVLTDTIDLIREDVGMSKESAQGAIDAVDGDTYYLDGLDRDYNPIRRRLPYAQLMAEIDARRRARLDAKPEAPHAGQGDGDASSPGGEGTQSADDQGDGSASSSDDDEESSMSSSQSDGSEQ